MAGRRWSSGGRVTRDPLGIWRRAPWPASGPAAGTECTTGQPTIDLAKGHAEERQDGKYLFWTSDDTLAPEDVALGCKQSLDIEDAYRTLNMALEIRAVYHRPEERIRSHLVLCWLALLLVRVIEEETGRRWPRCGRSWRTRTSSSIAADGTLHRRAVATHAQRQVFGALGLSEPRPFPGVTVTGTPAS